jgi:hypothetical protein
MYVPGLNIIKYRVIAANHLKREKILLSAPQRQVVLQACAVWLVTRLVFAVLTWGSVMLTANRVPSFSLGTLLQAWKHWDAGFFLAIAHYGYYSSVPTVFYPAYPLLVHLVAAALGQYRELPAALIVSNTGTLLAFIGLSVLALQEGYSTTGARHVLLVAASYPFAFFLAAPYSEGLFLALAVWCLVFIRRGAWYRAALCAFASALTRPTAIILMLPLLWEYGRQQGWWLALRKNWRFWSYFQQWRRNQRLSLRLFGVIRTMIVIEAVPFALALYALYCKIRFGDPWVFITSEQIYWLHRPMPPWEAITTSFIVYIRLLPWSYNQGRFLLDILPWLLFAILTLLNIRRIPFAFTLYMLGLLQLCIAAPIINVQFPFLFMSTGRFLLVSVPMFLLLSKWLEHYPWLETLIVSGGFMVQAALTLYYLQGGWIV